MPRIPGRPIEAAESQVERTVLETVRRTASMPVIDDDAAVFAAEVAVARRVVAAGRWLTPAARPKGVRLRKEGRCFGNAQALLLDRGVDCGWMYCEGYAVDMGGLRAVHHGFLCDGDGVVIDPTSRGTPLAYLGVVFPDARTVADLCLARNVFWSLLLPEEYTGPASYLICADVA